MKIGLYGGAFNPVHNEHVNVARAAVETLKLDKLIIIPTFISPHKRGDIIVRGRERIEMCRLAFASIPRAEISDCEIKRGGVSYSYVTCRRFKKQYAEDELYFIMGADMLASFHEWREPAEILKCATLAVCARAGQSDLKPLIIRFNERFGKEIVAVNYFGKAVSSTRVRTLAALGEDFSKFVPEKVKNFIRLNKLYYRPQLRDVKKYLTEERWQHSVRVALMAAENCSRVGVDELTAITAAALHDCAKYLDKEAPELYGFTPPPNVPKPVLHQYSGAYVAEHTFGIKDAEILNAIRYHTSGRENMGGLEKLIFLADTLEEGRDYPEVRELRAVFSRDIDRAMYVTLERLLEYRKSVGGDIYPLSKQAYDYYKELIKN